MFRACLFACTLVLTSVATAADPLPKDISAEARAEWLKKWQEGHTKRADEIKKKIEDANTLLKLPTTEAEGKKKLAEAKAEQKRLGAAGWYYPGHPFPSILAKAARPGDVVLIPGGNLFQLGEDLKEGGVIAEAILPEDKDTATLTRYLVASPVKLGKPVGKKQPAVDLTHLWYWAGSVDYKGKSIPVLYRFEIKKEDFPPAKK